MTLHVFSCRTSRSRDVTVEVGFEADRCDFFARVYLDGECQPTLKRSGLPYGTGVSEWLGGQGIPTPGEVVEAVDRDFVLSRLGAPASDRVIRFY